MFCVPVMMGLYIVGSDKPVAGDHRIFFPFGFTSIVMALLANRNFDGTIVVAKEWKLQYNYYLVCCN
jgi:hypothetical protein